MISQKIDFIDIQHATIGSRQHTWRKLRTALAKRCIQIQRAHQTLFGRTQRQGHELPAGQ
ncbi:hypothetical protein D3C76_1737270 [compost metagenome]